MRVCTNCQYQNPGIEDFCLGCGLELTTSATTTAPSSTAGATPAIAPAPTQPAVRTLTFGDKSFPLCEGQTFRIRRRDPQDPGAVADFFFDTDKDDVSAATPLELKVEAGKLFASYPGDTEKNYSVQKSVKPGQSVEAEPGEIVWAGSQPIIVT